MEAHNVRQRLKLEWAFLQKLRQKVGQPHLHAVSCIGPKHQGLRTDFAGFHLGQVVIQGTHLLNLFLQHEKPPLGVVPAEAVVGQSGLYRCNFKHPHMSVCIAGAGIGVQGSRREIRYEICRLQRGGFNFVFSGGCEDAKRWLLWLLAELAVDEIGVSGVQIVLGRRRWPVRQRHQRRYGRAVRIVSCAVLQPVKYPKQGPHPLVEMGVEVAVEDGVANHPVEASGSIEKIQCIALLGTDGDGVQDGGLGVLRI